MKRYTAKVALALLVALTGPLAASQAFAYGDKGHRTVGTIAARLIAGTNAEKEVNALLLPGEDLASLTVWADCIKGSFCGPQTKEMESFNAAHPKHQEFHYTNTPMQQGAYQPEGPGTSDHDIVQTLQQAIAVLQGKTDAASNPQGFTRREALLWVAHLVGDIHQPLHVSTAYIDKDNKFVQPKSRAEVDGVNIFDLRGDNNLLFADPAYDRKAYPDQPVRPQNLHFFWDITAVELAYARLKVETPDDFAKAALALGAPAPMQGEVAGWPLKWVEFGLKNGAVAHEGVQPVERKTNTSRNGTVYYTWTVSAPADYQDKAAKITIKQLVRGGVDFAALLKAIWP